MTIERPMFPPQADAPIIPFAALEQMRSRKEKRAEQQVRSLMAKGVDPRRQEGLWEDYTAAQRAKREARLPEVTTAPETLTESCRNQRLRQARREAWRTASHLTDYWRARLDWQSALSCAQGWNVADANSYPKSEDRWALIDLWRAALVQQMLTPAPDLAAVAWKRAKLRGERLGDVKPETIERSIAADEKWLAAHPARKNVPMSDEKKAERRNFKEAMRRRIKDIAAARDIPDDEIRPVLSLRHHLIGDFAEKYGVNLGWLLEGEGKIFRS